MKLCPSTCKGWLCMVTTMSTVLLVIILAILHAVREDETVIVKESEGHDKIKAAIDNSFSLIHGALNDQ